MRKENSASCQLSEEFGEIFIDDRIQHLIKMAHELKDGYYVQKKTIEMTGFWPIRKKYMPKDDAVYHIKTF
jgi:hypothetical protein